MLVSMERKLLFLSSTDVAEVRRRVHKKKHIQPLTKKPDTKPSLSGRQQHTIAVPARFQLFLEMVFSLLVVAIPFSVHAGIFPDVFASEETLAIPAEASASGSPLDVILLAAEQNPDPLGGRGSAEIVVSDNALVASGPIDEEQIATQSTNDEISVYTVREGDSLSQVAQMFGVTSNTILWANDLKKKTDIQPGDSLIILPIAGIRHVVKSGDTVKSIAKKYEGNAEEILSYNQLAQASDITVGETLIIPGGELHSEVQAANAKKPSKGSKSTGSGSAGFINPAPGSVKTQGIHGNNGVDLAGSTGSTIRAAAGGTVIVAKGGGGWNGGYGNYIVIKHKNGTQTLYAHLSTLSVGSGEVVDQGQTIGGMGNTGKSTGTHLHFEVRGGRNPF
jgi:LysM repeat protein